MKEPSEQYQDTANTLVQRIVQLFKDEPTARNIVEPFDLFKFKTFKCDDLEPTLFQASWALCKAKDMVK